MKCLHLCHGSGTWSLWLYYLGQKQVTGPTHNREKGIIQAGTPGLRVQWFTLESGRHSRYQTRVTRRKGPKGGVSLTQLRGAKTLRNSALRRNSRSFIGGAEDTLFLLHCCWFCCVWAAPSPALSCPSVPSRLLQLASKILPVINMQMWKPLFLRKSKNTTLEMTWVKFLCRRPQGHFHELKGISLNRSNSCLWQKSS